MLLQMERSEDPNAAALSGGSNEEVSAQTSEVMESMHQTVGALKSNIDKMQAENKEALSAQSLQYSQQLHSIEANISAIASANENLQVEIETATKRNAEKQNRAQEIERGNAKLREELDKMREQLRNGEEYVTEVVDTLADDGLVPALEVLRELDREDNLRAMAANAQGLKKVLGVDDADDAASVEADVEAQAASMIGDKKTAMLEGDSDTSSLAAGEGPAEDRASGTLEGLETTMQAYEKQHEAMEAKLKDEFVVKFKDRVLKRSALSKQQEEIKATLAERNALGERLDTAVLFLEKTRRELEERVKSVRASTGALA